MSKILEVRNCQALPEDMGNKVDCEINHADYGWIPFTAAEDDTTQDGKDLYAAIMAGTHGEITPYIVEDIVIPEGDVL